MDTHDPKDFVLNRELSEVHLLLDNLSANPDKTFALLKVDDSGELDKNWLDEICRIRWPPPNATLEAATQAALLIRAKDRLNVLAKPASGATIAFTLLVTQEDTPSIVTGKGRADAPTRQSLARDAYPGLVRKASGFRFYMYWLGWFLLAFLLLTCALSWYVAYGNATLAQATALQPALSAAEKRVLDAEAGVGDGAAPKMPGAVVGTAPAPGTVIGFCDRAQLLPPLKGPRGDIKSYESIAQMQACEGRAKVARQVSSVDRLLRGWLGPLASGRLHRSTLDSGSLQETLVYVQSVLNILAASVLPVFYGVLGAAAAVVRALSRKIKDSTLAPRDLWLSSQQLGLGAVMGACIGLFVAQPAAAGGDASPGLIGSVALSSSALSFVAGFGVEQVFTALEALMGRIFSVVQGPPAPASTPAKS